MSRYKPVGWRGESHRHYLASKGVKTKEEYLRWRQNVNMSASELNTFMKKYGDVAGLSRKEASAEGIKSGRDSARAIIRMKQKPVAEWNAGDVAWMRRQNSFVARMRGAKGPLYDDEGRPTRKLLALKVWGHDPEKKYLAVKAVDLKKYAGTWEQQSVKNVPWFQKGLTDVTATYRVRKDGRVEVVNRGVDEKGRIRTARGVARSVSPDNRTLKVSFSPFGLFEGEYKIKSVNPSYTRAVVKGGKTTWVLKREPKEKKMKDPVKGFDGIINHDHSFFGKMTRLIPNPEVAVVKKMDQDIGLVANGDGRKRW